MRRSWVAMAILAALAVAGCSHESAGGSRNAGGADSNAGGGLAATVPQGNHAAAAGSAPAAGRRQSYGGAAQAKSSEPLVGGAYKIVNAQLTVAVKGGPNVAAKADAAEGIALAAGGEVDSDDRTSGKNATATLQLRVPPEAVPDTMNRLSRLGSEISRQSSTTDVTQKVVDVQSRVASAQQSINRLRLLFDRATKVSDILALEDELNTREADLESLQAQSRALSRETSLATITLSLVTAAKKTAVAPVRHHKKRGGFIGGLQRGWHGFSATAVWVADAVGTLLPFLVLLLVLGLAGRLLWPRLPRRQHPAPAPSE